MSPGAGAHFYSAMKFALRAATEGIRVELRNMKSGIKVTVSNALVNVQKLYCNYRKFLQELFTLRFYNVLSNVMIKQLRISMIRFALR